ncbi:hypothetical protein ScPMuIL_008752 [Solemya velum]
MGRRGTRWDSCMGRRGTRWDSFTWQTRIVNFQIVKLWTIIILSTILVITRVDGLDQACVKINETQCPANYERCDPKTTTSVPTSVPISSTIKTDQNFTTDGNYTTELITTTPSPTDITETVTKSNIPTSTATDRSTSTSADGKNLTEGDNSTYSGNPPPPPESSEEGIFCKPIDEHEEVDLYLIIGVSVGSTVFIVVLLVVICCCCRCRSGEPEGESGDATESGVRPKRPISQLLWNKIKTKREDKPRTVLPSYENIQLSNTPTLANEVIQIHDSINRYNKDPTVNEKEKKMTSPDPVYTNQSSIWLHERQKGEQKYANEAVKRKKEIQPENEDIPEELAPPPPSEPDPTSHSITVPSNSSTQKGNPPVLRMDTHPNRMDTHPNRQNGNQVTEADVAACSNYEDMGDKNPTENYENFKFGLVDEVLDPTDSKEAAITEGLDPSDSREDYENVLNAGIVKSGKNESSGEDDIEDYENAPGKEYVNVPPKKSKK